MQCKVCRRPLRRVARKGIWQVKIFPVFGYYPWECPICRKTVMVRKQYLRKRPRSQSPQENSAD
jgi:hypothetical protein